MSNILQIGPETNGHPTNSADIQEALDQVGDGKNFDAIHFAAGIYDIDDSNGKRTYSVLAINNGTEMYGDVDKKGNPTTVFKLMDNAPVNPFGCGVPILGPARKIGSGIKIFNLEFDGNNKINATNQTPSTMAKCPGVRAGEGRNYGKGFHCFIGTYTARFQNCKFYNIFIHDSAGDGFRALHVGTHDRNCSDDPVEMNSNLELYNWTVINCGHCALMLEYAKNSQIHDCRIKTRSNGAVRTQNGCAGIDIKNIIVQGSSIDYNPGMQLSGSNITVTNCLILDTYGPGIEVQGNDDKDISIKNNTFINCGIFPKEGKILGVGGVITNGADVLIEDNIFVGCKGYAIGAAVYEGDGICCGKPDPNIIHKIHAINNTIVNTSPGLYDPVNQSGDNKPDVFSGAAIANIISSPNIRDRPNVHEHELYAARNIFFNNKYNLHNILYETVSPVTDTPNAVPSVTDTPVTGTSVTVTSVTGTSVTGTTVTGTTVTVTPVTVNPETGTPVSDTPVTATPVSDTPVTATPAAEDSVGESPVTFNLEDIALVIPLNEERSKVILEHMTSIELVEGKDYLILKRSN